jgi:hypothetical protein
MAFASACVLAAPLAPSSLYRDLLAARAAVDAAPPAAPGDRAASGKRMQTFTTLANLENFAGNYAGAIATVDRSGGVPVRANGVSAEETLQLEGAQAEDAIEAIVAAARGKRAVLINESHTVPMHRAFTQKLALELKKIGFSYLACEAFGDGTTPDMKYANVVTGYYTREPVFAGLVNAAIAQGYKLVPYDHTSEDRDLPPMERNARREQAQAQNIHDRIYANDKNAKVLIHVGHHHLAKVAMGQIKPMGAHLRRLLGEGATLHVDQSLFHARSIPAQENPLYRTILSSFPAASPFVLRAKSGAYLVLHGGPDFVDMAVVFPDYGDKDGRPAWLQSLAGREPRAIPAELLPAAGERLVLAYAKQHGEDATAIDAVLVQAGKPVPKLMLPKGEFRFKVQE